MAASGIFIAVVCLASVLLWRKWRYKPEQRTNLPLPPFVPLTQDEILKTPVHSMTTALREHGPIIRIIRNGNKEYLVAKEYTRQVLTDEKSFSFERGNAQFLGLKFVHQLHSGTFFRDMDSIIRDFLARHMEEIVPRVWPIFEAGASRLTQETQPGNYVDAIPHVQYTMAEATLSIFFGPEYCSPNLTRRAVDVAESIAELMGLFQNQSYLALNLPWLWRTYTWVSVVLVKIPLHLGTALGGKIWADVSRPQCFHRQKEHKDILSYLARRYATDDGRLSVVSKLWIFVLILTILFASLHQTATIVVWVTYYLALRPQSQESIRAESQAMFGSVVHDAADFPPSPQTMRQAALVDSFIREVLRMKGDSVNLVRESVRDVELAGYLIPKGSVILPVTYLSYRSPDYVPQPDEFRAERWVHSGKSAATTGPGYLAFGIGRWSCPGRILAVMEIKSWILALVRHGRLKLEGDKYEIIDPFNITSVPPAGRLRIERL